MSTLLAENNEKRAQLNAENKKVYEDMLVYVRLSFDKSEEETEEVLMELLDHLLVLQEEGRDSTELFGSNPRQYAQEILGELPKALPNKMMALFGMGVSYFLGVYLLISGLIQTIFSYGFHQLESTKTYSLGTTIIGIIEGGVFLSLAVYSVFRYMQWSCFREVSKRMEYLFSVLVLGVPAAVAFAMYFWLPSFGPSMTIPVYWLAITGAVFLMVGELLKRKS
ncbi:hypothetical protein CHL76_14610 [Marinococcus halophilus]|uniref:DUF1129 family protein n=1 Tax=Marinococcus halophilus TaxID=1371 RepID=A0A510Y9E0_MARHA|nr:DUF1129 family protein [Marinococcus halophilus]OZT79048.1 hypothetical protein CHL76_14610 [Marinococcus halophilus]GEK59968.1 hypothetical protein MHA01_28730 [Marinococcus halophilus]